MSRRLVLVLPFAADHGGLEQYAVSLASEAAGSGWSVTVLSPVELPEESWLRRRLAPVATWTAAPSTRDAVDVRTLEALASVRGRVQARLRGRTYGDDSGGRVGRRAVNDWFWSRSGGRALREADVVHLLGKPNRFVQRAVVEASGLGRPVLYSEIAHVDAEYAGRSHLVGFRDVADRVDAMTSYCPSHTEAMAEHFGYAGPIEAVDQWLDPDDEADLLALAPAGPTGDRPLLVGSLSRLGPEKDLVGLVAAFARARAATDRPTRLVIAGEGPEEEAVRRAVADHDLDDVVELRGYVADRIAFLGEVDVFVVSSTEEGGPISGLEAMAAGRAVVSTAVGAMPDRLAGLASARVVAPGDGDALAAALADLLAAAPDGAEVRQRYIDRNGDRRQQALMAGLWDRLAAAPRPSTPTLSDPSR